METAARRAVRTLVAAQREYELAIDQPRDARVAMKVVGADEPARLLVECKNTLLRSATTLDETVATLAKAQAGFDRAADALTTARELVVSRGLASPASMALDHAQKAVEDGRSRLQAAGVALRVARDRLVPS